MAAALVSQIPLVFVVAIAKNGVVGLAGSMPWHLPSDLQQFKLRTHNRPMIMGRKTLLSLPGLLPGRTHIVLSRTPGEDEAPGARAANSPALIWVTSPQEALDRAQQAIAEYRHEAEIAVIGGGEIFSIFEAVASELHVSHIEAEPEGDTFWRIPTSGNGESLWEQRSISNAIQGENDSAFYRVATYHKAN